MNLSVSVLDFFNKKYNNFEYISSGGYFGAAASGYILACPGSPISTYGTIYFQF